MLTKDDWIKLKHRITWFTPSYLLIDGYKIMITMKLVSETKYNYFIYVNGKFNPEWLYEDCEIRRKFIRKSTRRLYSKQKAEKITSHIRSKKLKKELSEKYGLEKTYDTYSPFWGSFSTLKAHLIKNNKDITIDQEEL